MRVWSQRLRELIRLGAPWVFSLVGLVLSLTGVTALVLLIWVSDHPTWGLVIFLASCVALLANGGTKLAEARDREIDAHRKTKSDLLEAQGERDTFKRTAETATRRQLSGMNDPPIVATNVMTRSVASSVVFGDVFGDMPSGADDEAISQKASDIDKATARIHAGELNSDGRFVVHLADLLALPGALFHGEVRENLEIVGPGTIFLAMNVDFDRCDCTGGRSALIPPVSPADPGVVLANGTTFRNCMFRDIQISGSPHVLSAIRLLSD